jgi:hypothetical protein
MVHRHGPLRGTLNAPQEYWLSRVVRRLNEQGDRNRLNLHNVHFLKGFRLLSEDRFVRKLRGTNDTAGHVFWASGDAAIPDGEADRPSESAAIRDAGAAVTPPDEKVAGAPEEEVAVAGAPPPQEDVAGGSEAQGEGPLSSPD